MSVHHFMSIHLIVVEIFQLIRKPLTYTPVAAEKQAGRPCRVTLLARQVKFKAVEIYTETGFDSISSFCAWGQVQQMGSVSRHPLWPGGFITHSSCTRTTSKHGQMRSWPELEVKQSNPVQTWAFSNCCDWAKTLIPSWRNDALKSRKQEKYETPWSMTIYHNSVCRHVH